MIVAVPTRARSGQKSQITLAGVRAGGVNAGVPSSEAASLAQEESNTRRRYGGVRLPHGESYAHSGELGRQRSYRS